VELLHADRVCLLTRDSARNVDGIRYIMEIEVGPALARLRPQRLGVNCASAEAWFLPNLESYAAAGLATSHVGTDPIWLPWEEGLCSSCSRPNKRMQPTHQPGHQICIRKFAACLAGG